MPLERPPTSILQDASLFLDFDGTLIELAPTPGGIEVGDEVRALLTRLQQKMDGRVALLSGRAVADLRQHVHPVNLAIGGSHGLERMLANGQVEATDPPAGLPAAIREFRRVGAQHPGVLVEEKPAGVALHYRNAPNAEGICHRTAQRVAGMTGLQVQLGNMVVELKDSAGDKGQALAKFMAEPPFEGTRPVFLGDDLTDEHAFAAARLMGGVGVLVGPERSTAATFRLEDVGDACRWLEQACGELE